MSPDKIFTFMVLLLVAAAAVKDFKSRQIPDTVNCNRICKDHSFS